MYSNSIIAVVLLAAATFAHDNTDNYRYPTDQSKQDQLDELNAFLRYYVQSLNTQLDTYNKMVETDKEFLPYIDAVTAIHKLIKQSWLRNMRPDERYYAAMGQQELQITEERIADEIKELNKITSIADSILLFNKVDAVPLLKDKYNTILSNIESLDESIKGAEEANDFDEADKLKTWKSVLAQQLENVKNDIRFSELLREMMLQSFILDFGVRHDGKTVRIKHSNGLEEEEKEFPVPPSDTLTVLEDIKFK